MNINRKNKSSVKIMRILLMDRAFSIFTITNIIVGYHFQYFLGYERKVYFRLN